MAWILEVMTRHSQGKQRSENWEKLRHPTAILKEKQYFSISSCSLVFKSIRKQTISVFIKNKEIITSKALKMWRTTQLESLKNIKMWALWAWSIYLFNVQWQQHITVEVWCRSISSVTTPLLHWCNRNSKWDRRNKNLFLNIDVVLQ